MNLNKRVLATLFGVAALVTGCGDNKPIEPLTKQVEQSPEQAFRDLLRKAQSGDASAQADIGWKYATGEGVRKDEKEALVWWNKSADQNDPEGLMAVGLTYYNGWSVNKDVKKGIEFMIKAADLGLPFACSEVGKMYRDGDGVKKDKLKAAAYMKIASDKGFTDAQVSYGVMNMLGDGVPENKAAAFELFQKAAADGNKSAQYNLGLCYNKGDGTPKNVQKAAEWYEKAAIQGHKGAQFKIGYMYGIGEGVPKDGVLGYAWTNIAASQGHETALSNRKIFESTLTPKEITEAQRLASNWKVGAAIQRENSVTTASPSAKNGGSLLKQGSGTAFFINQGGQAVTNYHVVDGCTELRIQGLDAPIKLVKFDAANDLAVLQATEAKSAAPIASDPSKMRQGDDVIVFGFPLNTLLSSGGNLTPGTVSALSGLANNTNQFQITAPIQPGSSGSPVLNKKGEVVGVVTAKLSDSKMIKSTGSVGQNVNFAVNGQVLKAFLDTNGVKYNTGSFSFMGKSNSDIADDARRWTTVVECWR